MESNSKRSLREGVETRISQQLEKNAARKIVSLVQSWQIKGDEAARRWVWELLQNAVDTAERCQKSLSVAFELQSEVLTYTHDGGPFLDEEIAALLLAGSAKPFDNSPYTGRFGTGVFVTHAVSPLVILTATAEGYAGGFRLTLDRRGREEEIQRNIEAGKRELELPLNGGAELTRFEYRELPPRGLEVARRGLTILDDLLPYIFAFNGRLQRVSIISDGVNVVWERRGEDSAKTRDGVPVRVIHLTRATDALSSLVDVHISSPYEDALAAAVIAIGAGERSLRELRPEEPRVYRNFPLLESQWTGLPVAIHAPFEVDEDRSALFIAGEGPAVDGREQDVASKNQALAIRIAERLVPFVSYVVQLHDVKKAHWATAVCIPREKFSEASRWRLALRDLGKALVSEPVVRVKLLGYMQPSECVFLKPVVGRTGTGVRLNSAGFWSLASMLGRPLPAEDLVEDWERIVTGWRDLGIEGLELWDMEGILEQVRRCKSIDDLGGRISADSEAALGWLADLTDLLSAHGSELPAQALSGVLPDQTGAFRQSGDLSIDAGIDEQLKDIAAQLGVDLRHQLLELRLIPADCPAARVAFLKAQIPKEMGIGMAVEQIVNQARTRLLQQATAKGKPGVRVQVDASLAIQTAKLVVWLAEHRPTHDAQVRGFPIITAAETIVSSTTEPSCVLPLEAWPDSAKEFVDVFPESRRVSSMYWGVAGAQKEVLQAALVEWGMCFKTLVVVEDELRLKGKAIQRLQIGQETQLGAETEYVCERMSRIPFLGDIIGRIGTDIDRARRFLLFLLKYVIRYDTQWQELTPAVADSEKDGKITIRASEWLGRILKDAWVPNPDGGEGSPGYLPASRSSLQGLMLWGEMDDDPRTSSFLELLGFDQLEVWIQATAGGDASREAELRNELASVAKWSGPDGLREIRQLIEEKQRQRDRVERNRKYGLHIQGLVKKLLEQHGKIVEVIDKGYDFRVYEQGDAEAESDYGQFAAGPYLVEVKATRTDEMRLTPMQARTAVRESGIYIVCAVDLRSIISGEPTIEEVAEHIRMVSGVGAKLQPFIENVQEVEVGTGDIRVDQTGQLRYCLGQSIWVTGQSLEDWVNTAFSS